LSRSFFDEAVLANPSSILQSEIYSSAEIDVRATLATAFFSGIVHITFPTGKFRVPE